MKLCKTLIVVSCVILFLSACGLQNTAVSTPVIYPTTETPTLALATRTPIPSSTIVTVTPSRTTTSPPTPKKKIDRDWLELSNIYVWEVLEPYGVIVDHNGLTSFGYDDTSQRWAVILDESRSSSGRTILIIEITRYGTPEEAKEASKTRYEGLKEEKFTDFQTRELRQFPEGAWLLEKGNHTVEFGSPYDRYEFDISYRNNMIGTGTKFPFSDVHQAMEIVLAIAKAQLIKFNPNLAEKYPSATPDHPIPTPAY